MWRWVCVWVYHLRNSTKIFSQSNLELHNFLSQAVNFLMEPNGTTWRLDPKNIDCKSGRERPNKYWWLIKEPSPQIGPIATLSCSCRPSSRSRPTLGMSVHLCSNWLNSPWRLDFKDTILTSHNFRVEIVLTLSPPPVMIHSDVKN